MVNKDSSPLLYRVVQFVQVQSKGSPSGRFLPFPVVPLSLEHFLAFWHVEASGFILHLLCPAWAWLLPEPLTSVSSGSRRRL